MYLSVVDVEGGRIGDRPIDLDAAQFELVADLTYYYFSLLISNFLQCSTLKILEKSSVVSITIILQ